jgi:hypothetical protein
VSRDNDLAELARRALERPDTVSVLGHAVDLVARSLALDHVTILELSPADRRLRLRAGIGWGGGVVGTTIDAMPGGHVAYTLASPDPVVVDDMASEQRFAVSPQLLDAGVRSSLSVAIPSGGESPFGRSGEQRVRIVGAPRWSRRRGNSIACELPVDRVSIQPRLEAERDVIRIPNGHKRGLFSPMRSEDEDSPNPA